MRSRLTPSLPPPAVPPPPAAVHFTGMGLASKYFPSPPFFVSRVLSIIPPSLVLPPSSTSAALRQTPTGDSIIRCSLLLALPLPLPPPTLLASAAESGVRAGGATPASAPSFVLAGVPTTACCVGASDPSPVMRGCGEAPAAPSPCVRRTFLSSLAALRVTGGQEAASRGLFFAGLLSSSATTTTCCCSCCGSAWSLAYACPLLVQAFKSVGCASDALSSESLMAVPCSTAPLRPVPSRASLPARLASPLAASPLAAPPASLAGLAPLLAAALADALAVKPPRFSDSRLLPLFCVRTGSSSVPPVSPVPPPPLTSPLPL